MNVALLAFAAERRAAAPLLLGARSLPLSIDISRPHGAQQQTRRTPQRLSNDGTDGRTDDRYVDFVPAHSAFSVKKQTLKTTHVLVVNGLYWSLAPVMF